MAVIQIPNLPTATALVGNELLEVVQAGISCQTTTQDVANLAVPILSFAGYYGEFLNTTTQASAGATSANLVTFDTTVATDSVTLAAGTRITVSNAGIYNFQFSAQVSKTDSGSDDFDIWMRLNGSNVASSNTRVTLTEANEATVVSRNYIVSLSANQYVELAWSSADADMSLTAYAGGTNPSRPGIPSIIATLTLVQGT